MLRYIIGEKVSRVEEERICILRMSFLFFKILKSNTGIFQKITVMRDLKTKCTSACEEIREIEFLLAKRFASKKEFAEGVPRKARISKDMQ